MKRVIIESPYRGDTSRNIAYAKRAIRDSLDRKEAPIASHLLFPNGILDDNNGVDRVLGITAGHAWFDVAELIVFYMDYGMSDGMILAEDRAAKLKIKREYRKIGA